MPRCSGTKAFDRIIFASRLKHKAAFLSSKFTESILPHLFCHISAETSGTVPALLCRCVWCAKLVCINSKKTPKKTPLNGILKPFCSFRMIVTDEDQLVSRSLIKAYFLDGIGMIPRIQHSAIVRFFFFLIFPGSSETGQETSKTTKRAYLCQCHKSSKFVIIISFFSCFWIKISIKSVIDSSGVHMAGFSPIQVRPVVY